MNTTFNVREHTYNGTRAITLTGDKYSAMVLPDIGGNLVSFNETTRNLSFLRTPQNPEEILSSPTAYGIPVMFPPNRYEDGTFTVNGRIYRFPINEIERNNHLHGFLLTVPWEVKEMGTSDGDAHVTLMHTTNEQHPMYQYFPHPFSIQMKYALSSEGLAHEVRVVNHGQDSMPFMFGLHTTLNVPFAPNSSRDDCTIMMTVGERWEMSDRLLPTGRIQPLTIDECHLKSTGVQPFFTQLDHHYTASPQGGRNFVKLTDHRIGAEFVYDVGLRYKHWMTFNNFGRGEYICPEPQTSIVNAPNSKLSRSESGLLLLEPGQEWIETSRMYVNPDLHPGQ